MRRFTTGINGAKTRRFLVPDRNRNCNLNPPDRKDYDQEYDYEGRHGAKILTKEEITKETKCRIRGAEWGLADGEGW